MPSPTPLVVAVLVAATLPARGQAGQDPATKAAPTPVFQPLPLGAIRPTGWLRAQLEVQAAGLGGTSRRVLARHQGQRLVRRQGRGLGARALLARRRGAAGLPA